MYDQSADAGQLTIPSYGVVDYTAQYQLSTQWALRLKVDNVFDKLYATSIRPFGYRPGKPRALSLGVSGEF